MLNILILPDRFSISLFIFNIDLLNSLQFSFWGDVEIVLKKLPVHGKQML
jgi:hypothetical protein